MHSSGETLAAPITLLTPICGGRADANFQVVLGRRQRAVKSEAAKGAGPFRGSLPARRSRRAAQAAHRERRQVGAQGTPQSQTITHVC